jgi:hypothetical protein
LVVRRRIGCHGGAAAPLLLLCWVRARRRGVLLHVLLLLLRLLQVAHLMLLEHVLLQEHVVLVQIGLLLVRVQRLCVRRSIPALRTLWCRGEAQQLQVRSREEWRKEVGDSYYMECKACIATFFQN